MFFASATMVAKLGAERFGVHAIWVVGFRFAIGFVATVPWLLANRSRIFPNNSPWVFARAASNVVAVLLFFMGIQATTVSRANLLNMSYPVFVFAWAPLVTQERSPPRLWLLLIVALLGAWLVVSPATAAGVISLGDGLAASSAVVAGFAIASLRRARMTDENATIMFYVMLLGLLVSAVLVPLVPRPVGLPGIAAAAVAGALGAAGQWALTAGFRGVSAPVGALISTARIPMAGIGGILLFGDDVSGGTLAGAILIVTAIIGSTLLQAQPRNQV